jgi:transposase
MQFETFLYCEPPRIECEKHGVKTMPLPWADKPSRFTQVFEAFAIKVIILASRSLKDEGDLLRLGWHPLHSIIKRAVERGWNDVGTMKLHGSEWTRSLSGKVTTTSRSSTTWKKFGCLMSLKAAKAQRPTISLRRPSTKGGAAIDMSAPFIQAIRNHLSHADIVHDKFHMAKHLNEAVDKTRRKEHRKLLKEKNERLTGTKYDRLKGMEHLSDASLAQVDALAKAELGVAGAWYKEALETRLPEIHKVARMLKKHLKNLLTCFDCYITNAASEGLNSKIQAIKANARGFRNFENYRVSILFFCGKLELSP